MYKKILLLLCLLLVLIICKKIWSYLDAAIYQKQLDSNPSIQLFQYNPGENAGILGYEMNQSRDRVFVLIGEDPHTTPSPKPYQKIVTLDLDGNVLDSFDLPIQSKTASDFRLLNNNILFWQIHDTLIEYQTVSRKMLTYPIVSANHRPDLLSAKIPKTIRILPHYSYEEIINWSTNWDTDLAILGDYFAIEMEYVKNSSEFQIEKNSHSLLSLVDQGTDIPGNISDIVGIENYLITPKILIGKQFILEPNRCIETHFEIGCVRFEYAIKSQENRKPIYIRTSFSKHRYPLSQRYIAKDGKLILLFENTLYFFAKK